MGRARGSLGHFCNTARLVQNEVNVRFTYMSRCRDESGYWVKRTQKQLSITFGELAGDNLIDLQTAIEYACSNVGQPLSGCANLTKLGTLRLDAKLIRTLVPKEMADAVIAQIVPRNPQQETHWEGMCITTTKDKIHVKVSEYLPVKKVNKLFTTYLQNAKFTDQESIRGSGIELNNHDLMKKSEQESKTSNQSKFLIGGLLLLVVVIGTGLYATDAFSKARSLFTSRGGQ